MPIQTITAGFGLAVVFVDRHVAGPIEMRGAISYILICLADHAASRKYWPVISSKTS
jgi:hypothetical protein